jgi:hypothetical protein
MTAGGTLSPTYTLKYEISKLKNAPLTLQPLSLPSVMNTGTDTKMTFKPTLKSSLAVLMPKKGPLKNAPVLPVVSCCLSGQSVAWTAGRELGSGSVHAI